jgi:hypothetical protein
MDEVVVPHLTRSEDVSAFGERDARQVGAAAARIQRPGDFVVIESQHRTLRDHYVKQILSLVFTSHPSLVVRRCKRDREWMIATINNALEKKEGSPSIAGSSELTEIWVVDLNSSEDFDLVKLAQTLVAQFAEGGVCMIVSCSPVVTEHPLFRRWAARLAIPTWAFELPDSDAMKRFLDQETQTGAANQARQLVNELELSLVNSPVAIKEETSLSDHYSKVDLNSAVNSAVQSKAERIVPLAAKETLGSLQPEKSFNQELKNAAKLKLTEVKLETAKNTMSFAKVGVYASVIFLLSLGTVWVLINESAFRWLEQTVLEIELPKWETLVGFSVNQELISPSDLVSEEDRLKAASQWSTNENASTPIVEESYEEETSINKNELQVILDLGDQLPEISRAGRTSRSFEVSGLALEKDQKMKLSNSSLKAKTLRSSVKLMSEVVDQKLRPVEFFAQLAAFSSRSSAQIWRRSRSNILPKTSVVQKNGGLWAVVSGPFNSEKLAESAFLQKRISVYVVKGNDLKLGSIKGA